MIHKKLEMYQQQQNHFVNGQVQYKHYSEYKNKYNLKKKN
jgi:hypothetical protein